MNIQYLDKKIPKAQKSKRSSKGESVLENNHFASLRRKTSSSGFGLSESSFTSQIVSLIFTSKEIILEATINQHYLIMHGKENF
jgi:hypothetical protein